MLQAKAVPPSQPLVVVVSEIGLSSASQVRTGELTSALSSQAQEGLQQSQYLVVLPVPEAARTARGPARATAIAEDRIFAKVNEGILKRDDWVEREC